MLVATSSRDRITVRFGGVSSKARMAVTSPVRVFVELVQLFFEPGCDCFDDFLGVIIMAVFMRSF